MLKNLLSLFFFMIGYKDEYERFTKAKLTLREQKYARVFIYACLIANFMFWKFIL